MYLVRRGTRSVITCTFRRPLFWNVRLARWKFRLWDTGDLFRAAHTVLCVHQMELKKRRKKKENAYASPGFFRYLGAVILLTQHCLISFSCRRFGFLRHLRTKFQRANILSIARSFWTQWFPCSRSGLRDLFNRSNTFALSATNRRLRVRGSNQRGRWYRGIIISFHRVDRCAHE